MAQDTVVDEVVLEDVEHDGGGAWRSVVAGICGVLAVVALTLALIGIWARATVFDSDKIGDIVASALADPEVTAGLATWVTDEVFAAVDVETAVSNVLPGNLARLAPTLTAGAESVVDRGLERALANPDVQQALTQAVERAHSALMQLLSGDGLIDGITVAGRCGDRQLAAADVTCPHRCCKTALDCSNKSSCPELTRVGRPRRRRSPNSSRRPAAISRTTSVSSPCSRATASPKRRRRCRTRNAPSPCSSGRRGCSPRWRRVPGRHDRLLARNRLRAGLWLALGCIVGMVLSRTVVHRVVDDAPSLVPGAAGRAAIADILGEATTGLLRLTGLIAIIAALVVVWTLFQRGWIGGDLLLVGAVVLGLAVVAVVGFSLGSVLLGVVLAVAAVLFVPRLVASRRQVAPTT